MSYGPKLVSIDVGGTVYRTTMQTLTRIPDCMLAIMVDQKWKADDDEGGELFIDRDGKPFQFILNYLRDDSRVVLPDDAFQLRQLSHEAVYFILPKLQEICEEKLKAIEQPPQDARSNILNALLQGNADNLGILVNASRDKLEILLKSCECQEKIDINAVLQNAAQQD